MLAPTGFSQGYDQGPSGGILERWKGLESARVALIITLRNASTESYQPDAQARDNQGLAQASLACASGWYHEVTIKAIKVGHDRIFVFVAAFGGKRGPRRPQSGECSELVKAARERHGQAVHRPVVSLHPCGAPDGSLYTGITKDLTRRIRQHNEGTASRYTRSRRPVKLVTRRANGARAWR